MNDKNYINDITGTDTAEIFMCNVDMFSDNWHFQTIPTSDAMPCSVAVVKYVDV